MSMDAAMKRLREATGEINAAIANLYQEGGLCEIKGVDNNAIGMYRGTQFVVINVTSNTRDATIKDDESFTPFTDLVGR